MPTASAISSASDNEASVLSIDEILPSVKNLSMTDLVRLSKSISLEMEKKFKAYEKDVSKKANKPKRAGTLPKGVMPPQFVKPNAWKAFVLEDAKKNGWPAITVETKRKDRNTGESVPVEIHYSASTVVDGVHVFKETGRPMNEKDAMLLSKTYWNEKEGSGLRNDLWREFEKQYAEKNTTRSASASSASSSASSSSTTPATTPLVESTAVKPATMKRVSKKIAPISQ